MKISKSYCHNQRRLLDQKIQTLSSIKHLITPKSGWIKPIRESLGLTTTLVAKRLHITQSSFSRLEKREAKKTITLELLEKISKSMDCQLFYAILPKETSLDDLLEKRSLQVAQKILDVVNHSMNLEDQHVDQRENQDQLKAIAKELKDSLDPRIWDSL